jgi:hypothetical protein
MNIGRTLAITALMGLLVGCGGQQPATAKAPTSDPLDPNTMAKDGCGNHPDGGSCGAVDPPAPPKAP